MKTFETASNYDKIAYHWASDALCLGQPLYHAALGIPKILQLMDRFGCICRHLEYDQYPELHLYLIVQKAQAH